MSDQLREALRNRFGDKTTNIILRLLVEHRDEVLATLGMMQVAWMDRNGHLYGLGWVTPDLGDDVLALFTPVFASVPEGASDADR